LKLLRDRFVAVSIRSVLMSLRTEMRRLWCYCM